MKAGKLHAQYVRDLRGVLEREKAEMAALLCLEEPTKPMRAEAARLVFTNRRGGSIPGCRS